MKKIIYCANASGSNYHLETINKLKKEHNWEPVVANFPEKIIKVVKKQYPDVFFTNSMNVRRGKFFNLEKKDAVPLEKDILENLKKFETRYFASLDDTTGWNYSFSERYENFYEVMKYWNSIFKKFTPDILICFNWPHVSSDYSLYLIAKHHFKIPTLFLNPIPLFNKSYFIIGTSMENSSDIFEKKYNANDKLTNSDFITAHMSDFESRPSPPHYQAKYLNHLKNKKFYGLTRILYYFLTGKIFKKLDIPLKNSRHRIDSVKSVPSILDHIKLIYKKRTLNRKLKIFYEKNSVSNIESNKYIYFPAQYVPEVNSVLMLENFREQTLILEMISKSLPEGWKILYKEHIETFQSLKLSSPFRTIDYYKKLLKIDGLIFVSSNIDTFELIKNSKITVGLGTAGWESLLLKKPVMSFDNIWYSACKSVFKVSSIEEIKKAIKTIEDGYVINIDDVKKYAEAIFSLCFKSTIYSEKEEFIIPDDLMLKNDYIKLADEFVKSYKMHYLNEK